MVPIVHERTIFTDISAKAWHDSVLQSQSQSNTTQIIIYPAPAAIEIKKLDFYP